MRQFAIRFQIDVYVWIDASGRTAVQPQRLFRHESPLKETVRELLQLGKTVAETGIAEPSTYRAGFKLWQ